MNRPPRGLIVIDSKSSVLSADEVKLLNAYRCMGQINQTMLTRGAVGLAEHHATEVHRVPALRVVAGGVQ